MHTLSRSIWPWSSPGPSLRVPIRMLRERHRSRITEHLLELSPADRYLRFGYVARDAQVLQYIAALDFTRDDILGIFDRRLRLIATAHLAYSRESITPDCAEFGVSVRAAARGRGFGARMFERAALLARNRGVHLLFIHALSENRAMLHIARQAGATVERDGADSDAYLKLPPPALDSRLGALIARQWAEFDYRLKVQAGIFRTWLRTLQEVRAGVQDARQRTGS